MNRELETRYTQMKLAWKNLVNANIDLVDENKMLKEENERLNNIIFNQNKRNSHQRIANDNLQNKNKKLNNIINEFEEYLNKVIETSSEQEKITCSFVLQYLQKLKGSDKE